MNVKWNSVSFHLCKGKVFIAGLCNQCWAFLITHGDSNAISGAFVFEMKELPTVFVNSLFILDFVVDSI